MKRIETIAVHVTIDTERNGDSQRTCSNDAVEESTVQTGWPSQGWRRLRLQLGKQCRQRFLMRTHDQKHARALSTSKALGKTSNVQRTICEIHRVAQEDPGVSDGLLVVQLSGQ